jgi:putative transposase
MKQSRITEAQIIGILKEQKGGSPTVEICRKHGVSSATVCKYKARFGAMDVSEAQRLKALEDENAKLKQLLTKPMPDLAILKDVAAKKGDTRCKALGGGACRGGDECVNAT